MRTRPSYRYATLYSPDGERRVAVLTETRRGVEILADPEHGLPKATRRTIRKIGRHGEFIEISPGDSDYFEAVVASFAKSFGIGELGSDNERYRQLISDATPGYLSRRSSRYKALREADRRSRRLRAKQKTQKIRVKRKSEVEIDREEEMVAGYVDVA